MYKVNYYSIKLDSDYSRKQYDMIREYCEASGFKKFQAFTTGYAYKSRYITRGSQGIPQPVFEGITDPATGVFYHNWYEEMYFTHKHRDHIKKGYYLTSCDSTDVYPQADVNLEIPEEKCKWEDDEVYFFIKKRFDATTGLKGDLLDAIICCKHFYDLNESQDAILNKYLNAIISQPNDTLTPEILHSLHESIFGPVVNHLKRILRKPADRE